MKTTKIVIVGGGFAGLSAAMHLDKTLARRADIEVTLTKTGKFHPPTAQHVLRQGILKRRFLVALQRRSCIRRKGSWRPLDAGLAWQRFLA